MHGAFASDAEVHRVVGVSQQFGEPNYVEDILAASGGGDDNMGGSDSRNHDGDQRDSLYDEAVACVIKKPKKPPLLPCNAICASAITAPLI